MGKQCRYEISRHMHAAYQDQSTQLGSCAMLVTTDHLLGIKTSTVWLPLFENNLGNKTHSAGPCQCYFIMIYFSNYLEFFKQFSRCIWTLTPEYSEFREMESEQCEARCRLLYRHIIRDLVFTLKYKNSLYTYWI